jgi:drug/metabolite transporter (DMT)-like permease
MDNAVIILAFSAMILWSIGDFLIQKTSKRIGNFYTLIFINFAAFILLFPFIIGDFKLLSIDNLFTLFALTLVDFVYGLTILKALERGKLSVVEVIATMELPITIIMGMVFFKEKISISQFFIIIAILVGVVLMSKGSKNFWQKIQALLSKKSYFIEKGAVLAFFAALLSSFYNFYVAINSRDTSPLMTIWFSWTLSLFLLLIYIFIKKGWHKGMQEILINFKNNKKIVIYGSIVDVLAWLAYAGALSRGELSITTAITESYPALAMFLGIRFNREKISLLQFIGAMLALGGSIIIIFVN